MDYLANPKAIYDKSFATIRDEADLVRFDDGERALAIRLIHACGMVDIVDDLVIAPGAIEAGRLALAEGAPIICDVKMVQHGIIMRNLPANNAVFCGLDEVGRQPQSQTDNTRSALGIEALKAHIPGAIIAIGNAPTALFRLLELIDAGLEKPAIILGLPVGFVGAAESKAELIANPRGVHFVALEGRRGGSALAAAAVNALAVGLST